MNISKRKIFIVHSWCGLIAGIFTLAISLTGAFISLSKKYDRLIHKSITNVNPSDGNIQYDKVFANAKKHLPNFKLYDFARIPQERNEAIELLYFPDGSYHSAFFNPYTGAFLGKLEYNVSRTLTKFHWSFFAGQWGTWVAFFCGLCICISVLTGFVIYKKHIWHALTFQLKWKHNRGGISSSALHRAIGVYTSLFMLILFSTGAFINYEILMGDFSYPQGEQLKQPPKYYLSISIDSLIQKINHSEPTFTPTYISFPQLMGGPITVGGVFKADNEWTTQNSSFEFDEYTGKMITFNDGRVLSKIDQVKTIIYNLHFADFGGLWLKIIYCLFGLLSGLMPITGFILWNKK